MKLNENDRYETESQLASTYEEIGIFSRSDNAIVLTKKKNIRSDKTGA